MADIVLFRPQASESINRRCPLSLVYIATPLVKKGFSVKIIDEEACLDWRQQLKEALGADTICAGVSVMTGSPIKSALEFSMRVKDEMQVPVIWGGIHPSFLPQQTLENELVDIVVMGEGEETMLKLVEHLKNGRSLENINNIAFKEDGKIVFAREGNGFLDLNCLPVPDYSLVDFDYYSSHKREFMHRKKRVLDLNVDRGCPHRCSFCYNINFNKRRWRAMDAERVVDVLEYLINKHKVDAINLVSDQFFVNKKRVYKICKGIIDKGFDIEWHADIRIDTFLRLDDELIGLIKKSGCSALTFGIESGSDRILKMIEKDISTKDVLKAHKRAIDFDFEVKYHFMIGFPEETKEDIVETVKLIRKLTRDKNTVIYGPSVYVPYPGTPLYDKCVEMGFKVPERLVDWINYEWGVDSKLPWFTKRFKNYISEVKTICEYSTHKRASKKNILSIMYRDYCKLRLFGLAHGIRLFDLDNKAIRAVKSHLSA